MLDTRYLAIGGAAVVAVAALVIFKPFSSKAPVQEAVVVSEQKAAAPAEKAPEARQVAAKAEKSPLPDMAIGSPNAPVTIIEYSSLSCPHCAAFHKEVLPKLKSEYIETGKVRYVIREFPLNESALAGAVVARCLDASRYFPFVELLFDRQEDWAYKEDAITPLKQFAKQAGLPEEKFNKCIENEDLQKQILAVREQGSKNGVKATPSLFVNGKLVKGGTDLATLAEAMKPYLGS